ncbi:MAG: tRNA (adenosine(37)-N6)-threonylcarbamoyltransferase complex transferase subunit TsaD, partial [Bacteroidales bacterium]|nr:tRNA (adenosine(37)-N6)-threonylcarbamoyltransferase complex transferase subunit TsaD [Bacteroidales bacterium]
ASLQKTIVDILMAKLKKAAKQTGIKQIAIGGGVSANSGLQKAVYDEGAHLGWEVFIPRLGFSLDNAGMVAVTGYYKYLASQFIGLEAPADARMSLRKV